MLENLRGNRTLGVFLDGSTLYCAELETLGEKRFRVRSVRAEELGGPSEDAPYTAAAELLERLCRTFGHASDGLEICLPRERFFIYERDFPVMEREEFCSAARWDIETNVPFEEGSYWSGFGSHGERTELAAVEATHGRALVDALTDAGLAVAGLTMEPLRFSLRRKGTQLLWRDAEITLSSGQARMPWTHGLDMALFAALRRYYPHVGIEFLPESERTQNPWAWRLGGYAVLGLTVAVVFVLLVGNFWQLSAAETRLEELRQEQAIKARERDVMEELSAARGGIEETERRLDALSKARLSWYGILSFLGSVQVDGVFLSGFDTQDDGVLVCRGRAMDYAALSGFLRRLEAEMPILGEKPELRESEAEASGYIRFSMGLRLREAAP
ncbi:MAG: PilN domain-containing protein [Schwartzia sp.]|nr:PilN domain-containing protein [Schwartzia sp. (in: firmicutes)]